MQSHFSALWACDFLTAEVWTPFGLKTRYILFFIHLKTRRVHVAGITGHPNGPWMTQIARNLTQDKYGIFKPGEYLIRDRDTKFCRLFDNTLKDAGITPLPLPARSPNLNAFAERWVRSIKDECLSQMIIFGDEMLRQVVREYLRHYNRERPHQGLDNTIPFPRDGTGSKGEPILKTSRLGETLNYYYRKAA